ncbi:MAG: hypothetical protein R6U98_01815 [Pirellulaceae bacterium]
MSAKERERKREIDQQVVSGSSRLNRRHFLAVSGAATPAILMGPAFTTSAIAGSENAVRAKKPARIAAVFLFPPKDVVHEGRMEDGWSKHNWFTYPSYQFKYKEQKAKFTRHIEEMAERLGVEVSFAPEPIWQQEKVEEFIARTKDETPDAVLVINFYNSLSGAAYKIAKEAAPTGIVYEPVGAQHQKPNQQLFHAEGLHFVQGIEDWDGIEEGLRAVRAKKMLSQSRMLRVAGDRHGEGREDFLGMDVISVPASEYNDLFDSIKPDENMKKEAMQFKQRAARIMDGIPDDLFVDAMRAHQTVHRMMERHDADAITIKCLMLEHRKPCISFCLNNGNLIPSGCENHFDGTSTLMLGRWLMDRGGFLHNPGFNPRDNQYYGSHCTCTLKLHGPKGPKADFFLRPFTHQLPKTPALDVQWNPGEPVMLAKYHSGPGRVTCWSGKVVESPTMPPTGGCATRVLVEMDDVDDVQDVYPGSHPILFCGTPSEARRWRAFARMYELDFVGNVRI